MARLTLEHDRERRRADDPGDDPDLDAFPLEHGALLDVQLQVAGERGRVAARGQDAFLAEPHARELRHQEIAAATWRHETFAGE